MFIRHGMKEMPKQSFTLFLEYWCIIFGGGNQLLQLILAHGSKWPEPIDSRFGKWSPNSTIQYTVDFNRQPKRMDKHKADGKPSTMVTAGGTRRAHSVQHERNDQTETSTFHHFCSFCCICVVMFPDFAGVPSQSEIIV